MGIRHLNTYLLKQCSNSSIKNIHLSELRNKKLSVDISIYLYNFESKGNLINGIYEMINIFKFYGIIPVFIFDGKPPNEKKYIIQERKNKKEKNKEKIKELNSKLNNLNDNIPSEEKNNILLNIEKLQRQTIFITREKIEQVKNIIRICGATYYDAPQEADELCSILAIREQVWGCISEDMDIFIYGCPRIIRYFNIFNKTAKLYNLENILYDLNISFNHFKQICILSGTDYNSFNNKYNLLKSIRLYNDYLEYINIHKIENTYSQFEFIQWIITYIDSSLNYDLLLKIYHMFELNNNKLPKFKNILIMTNNYNYNS
jgi:flap endonuclease-1